ncbi:phage terminase large subunit (GpA) [delta proteobacterium NaphS2]|nr:phage terminase large subunit (GpA) [delta proteobacterium NaphS2]
MITSAVLDNVWDNWRPGLTRNVAAWADKNRRLTKHSSQYVGKWRTDRFFYQAGPMDAFSSKRVRLIVLKWGTQLGKTEIQLNCMGYAIDEAPGPVLGVYPSEKIVKKVSSTRIQPMINSCPVLRSKKHPAADKFKIEEMHFQDCILYCVSAQVPGDLASTPIQYFFGDELGKFPTFSGKEGDPVGLAMERQKAFPFTSKTVLVSSPTNPEGTISRYFNSCEERLMFFVPCPHCGTMQTLEFSQIRWDTKGLPSTDPASWRLAKKSAVYICPSCQETISDRQKNRILQQGEWLREDGSEPDPETESIGFHLSSLYSPLLTWGAIAAKFLEVKNDPPRFMVFVNGWFAEEWEDAAVEKKEPDDILASHITDRAPSVVPAGTWALTMGVDSQATGFYYVIRAWQRDRTSYLIDYGFLPSLEDVRQAVFERSYPIEDSDQRIGIWRAAIDTGGTRLDAGPSMTEQIYTWLRRIPSGLIYGIKGSSWKTGVRVQHKIIDKMPGTFGKPLRGGITLFLLDVAAFKEALHYRLSLAKNEPGAFLFHSQTGEDYANQLLSEYKRRDTRSGKEAWVKIKGRENHYLDCEIYAMACTDMQFLGGIDVLRQPGSIAGRQRRKKPAVKYRSSMFNG